LPKRQQTNYRTKCSNLINLCNSLVTISTSEYIQRIIGTTIAAFCWLAVGSAFSLLPLLLCVALRDDIRIMQIWHRAAFDYGKTMWRFFSKRHWWNVL